ncbi:MAG TPA: ATP-binding protein, partial [Candidatus Ozemobacteraceae bacterium]|nr:ATP-binding protein [Candidatus Ozemobacteraceae bacterium]
LPAGTGEDALLHDSLRTEIQHLLDEILAYRHLQQAETGKLQMKWSGIHLRGFLDQLVRGCQTQECAQHRSIVIEPPVPEQELLTDDRLLRRILVNLIKNALEATPTGEAIRVRCRPESEFIRFEVWNPGAIPVVVQYQIFQKSFSTKGMPGRGLGTYSAKLLGERGLRGHLSFNSDALSGTTFTFLHPLNSDKAAPQAQSS